VGVAVDIAGTVYRGASGGAGEIGYLPVPPAGAAIEPEARDLTDLIGHGAFERCVGDLDAFAERIAIAIAPVLAVLDPELVVLGGPNGTAGGPELAERVEARLRATTRWHPAVRVSSIVGDPVLGGARRLLSARLRDLILAEVESNTTRNHTTYLGGSK
jgi:predicted NBD/HSP70 family sugar kinase